MLHGFVLDSTGKTNNQINNGKSLLLCGSTLDIISTYYHQEECCLFTLLCDSVFDIVLIYIINEILLHISDNLKHVLH